MTLLEEISALQVADRLREQNGRVQARLKAIEEMEASFGYVFGEAAEKVGWEKHGAVAYKDGLRFAIVRSSSAPSLRLVCACNACGQEFISAESLGATKNVYGPRHERTAEQKRETAIKQLSKLAARDYQADTYGRDHKCYEGTLLAVQAAAKAAAQDLHLSVYEVLERVSNL